MTSDVDWYPGCDLVGRRTRIERLGPQDLGFVSTLCAEPGNAIRWGLRVDPRGADSLAQSLLAHMFVPMKVLSTEGQPIGVVFGKDPDFRNGHCAVTFALSESFTARGWPLEGFGLFVRHLFSTYRLRKIYCEVIDFNLPQFESSLETFFDVEARLTGHEMVSGRPCDVYILALSAERFAAVAGRFGL